MDNIVEKSEKWADNARAIKNRLEDEAYEITTELIKKFGKEEENNFVINLEEKPENTIYVMEYDGMEGDYIGRIITKIELSKKYGGISLIYGDDDYEFIKYSDVLVTDRIYIVDELLSMFS